MTPSMRRASGIAGLNFVGNAVYHPAADGKNNVTQFEIDPLAAGQLRHPGRGPHAAEKTNIVNIPFSDQLPLAQLHWLIADKTGQHRCGIYRRRPAHLLMTRWAC